MLWIMVTWWFSWVITVTVQWSVSTNLESAPWDELWVDIPLVGAKTIPFLPHDRLLVRLTVTYSYSIRIRIVYTINTYQLVCSLGCAFLFRLGRTTTKAAVLTSTSRMDWKWKIFNRYFMENLQGNPNIRGHDGFLQNFLLKPSIDWRCRCQVTMTSSHLYQSPRGTGWSWSVLFLSPRLDTCLELMGSDFRCLTRIRLGGRSCLYEMASTQQKVGV